MESTTPTWPWWVMLGCSSEHHSTWGASRSLCPNKMGRLQWCFMGDPSPCWTVGLTAPDISSCIGKSCQKVTSKQSRCTVRCLSLQWAINWEITNPIGSSRHCLEGKIPSTSTNILKIAMESRGWLNSYLHSILSRPAVVQKFHCNICVWMSL